MRAEQHQKAPAHFEHIGEKHHPAFGHRVGKKPHVGCQADVAHNKEQFQKRRHPIGRVHLRQERNGGNEQRIVR